MNLSAAVRRRKTGRLVALDADPLSLKEVRESYSCFGVETCHASFRELIGNRNLEGKFDFVYSTGLFDYLNQRIARRLVSGMFNALRPGGSLLVANFLQGVRDIGYMETFMDWNLVYRSRCEMVDLTMGIPEEQVKEVSVHSEEHRNIVFMQIDKELMGEPLDWQSHSVFAVIDALQSMPFFSVTRDKAANRSSGKMGLVR